MLVKVVAVKKVLNPAGTAVVEEVVLFAEDNISAPDQSVAILMSGAKNVAALKDVKPFELRLVATQLG